MANASRSLRAAAALGAASGARTFAGAAVLALRGRPRAGWARAALLTLAGGEAVADKLPMTPPRSDPPALAGRVVAGALVGGVTAGARAARAGAAFALATAYASERTRALLGEKTGLPDPAIAVAEDALTYGGAYAAAAGRVPERPLPPLLAGPLATLVGAGAMTGAQTAYYKLTGTATGKSVPEGELPALGVAPPPWRQSPSSLAVDLGFHLVYGLATAAAFEALTA